MGQDGSLRDKLFRQRCTDVYLDLLFQAKSSELSQVADKYSISLDEIKGVLKEELLESNSKIGVCNTAVDFLIVEALQDNKMHSTIKDGIKSNISASELYWCNVENKPEYV